MRDMPVTLDGEDVGNSDYDEAMVMLVLVVTTV